jgi:hypothetical protein
VTISFIFCLCGFRYLIKAYKYTRGAQRDAAEALQKKMELVEKMQKQLREKDGRYRDTPKN